MKLGISYNLFDGEELLEGSIKAIRSEVDFISVVYQTISNHNQQCTSELVPLLERLHGEGLVDVLELYEPDFKFVPSANETIKRNIGLNLSKRENCTHHMSMDSDEFYDIEQFRKPKKVIEDGDYHNSACKMRTYYKEPIYQMLPPDEYYVPFICKILPQSIMGAGCPAYADYTRGMGLSKPIIFTREELEMHHMSYVRRSVWRKLGNSSSLKAYANRLDYYCKFFDNWKYPNIIEVPIGKVSKPHLVDNKFNINIH